MTTLNEKINNYYKLSKQMSELKAQADTLKEEILKEMIAQNCKKQITENGVSATVVDKELFSYTDELGIITYLKNNGLTKFISEEINTTELNKELKKSSSLCESLNKYYVKNNKSTLTVKEEGIK